MTGTPKTQAARTGLLAALWISLAALMPAMAARAQEPVGELRWPQLAWWPGGLSGLVLSADGGQMLAVSDQGYLIRAGIERDGIGRIRALSAPERLELARPPRARWSDSWLYTDAEGLAMLPDGRIAVAWEGLHRVTLHHPDGRFAQWIDVPETFGAFAVNESLEGVAVTEDGTILALAEGWPPEGDARVPLFAFEGGDWRIRAWLALSEGFRPVGLDLDTVGRLYVLERRFDWLLGFQSRIRRFDLGPDGLSGEVRLLRTAPDRYGNLEGLSLWRHPDGTLIATLVADNNLNPLLPRGLVEFRLPEPD